MLESEGRLSRARRYDRSDRFGNVVTDRIELGEAGTRPRQVRVQHEPLDRSVVVGELDAAARARSARLGRAFVALNTSSESRWRNQYVNVLCRCGMATVRAPTSAPTARTSGVTRSAGLPSASTVIVVPLASLLWKPLPAST